MPKCVCGSWNLEKTHDYKCVLSGDHVKWYRCSDCGYDRIETINGVTLYHD